MNQVAQHLDGSERSGSGVELVTHWLGGRPAESASGQTFPNWDPATGEAYASVCRGGEADVQRAVQLAWEAAADWGELSAADRADLLEAIAAKMVVAVDDLAAVESRDTGKPLRLARLVDAPALARELRFYASALRSLRDVLHAGNPEALGMTLNQPYGVVGLLLPWNYPLGVFAEKVAQILAAGNCVVVKPSEHTPASALLAARLMTEAGLPAGVINVVQGLGEEAGVALCEDARVPRLSFTGSTATGERVLLATATAIKHVTLELSGKNPCLVFDDADVRAAAESMVLSGFVNSGQLCTAGSLLLVHAGVEQEFCERYLEGIRRLRIGRPTDPGTDLGPIITEHHYERVRGYVDRAIDDPTCEVLVAGDAPSGSRGWYVAPHVFRVRDPAHELVREEVFGPVTVVVPFGGEDEAVQVANSNPYGLASFVWTNDLARSLRLSRRLQTGRVWLNTAHAIPADMTLSGWKASGLGSEGGLEGLRSFMQVKTVNVSQGGGAPSFPFADEP